jgi:DNA-binding CsgD family transcriptional regulator
MARPKTFDGQQIMRWRKHGWTLKRVAEKLGCSIGTVALTIRAFDGPKLSVGRPQMYDAQLIKDLAATHSLTEVAELIGCSIGTVSYNVKK